ncbi:MAG: hypothetical protein HQK84_10625, partial [Nitrospinae bacterium]|nr:hypothetical protein [Nitrospinota bacterium]
MKTVNIVLVAFVMCLSTVSMSYGLCKKSSMVERLSNKYESLKKVSFLKKKIYENPQDGYPYYLLAKHYLESDDKN